MGGEGRHSSIPPINCRVLIKAPIDRNGSIGRIVGPGGKFQLGGGDRKGGNQQHSPIVCNGVMGGGRGSVMGDGGWKWGLLWGDGGWKWGL